MYTKVYTQNPASMKYRGVFSKNKELSKPGCLVYTSEFGIAGDFKTIVDKYNKIKK